MVIVLQIIGTPRCLIHEHKELIMGTLLCDFFGPKKIQIIVTISWLVRFEGGEGTKKTSSLFAQLRYTVDIMLIPPPPGTFFPDTKGWGGGEFSIFQQNRFLT